MVRGELVDRIDESLMRRIAELSPATQRWLKTAVQAMRTMPASGDREVAEIPPEHLQRRPPKRRLAPPAVEPSTPGLEDVITGKARLEDLDQYPELESELEGLGEIIDMLRNAGEARRKRGDEILREEILGQPPKKRKKPRAEDTEEEDDFRF